MFSHLKSCFCPQGHNRSEINRQNAFIPIRVSTLGNIEDIEDNSQTIRSNNLSPHRKIKKVSEVFDNVPQELNIGSYVSAVSSITTTPIIKQIKTQILEAKHKKLIQKIKEAEVKKYIYTPKQGNIGLIAQAHKDRIEKIENLNFEDAIIEYNKYVEQGVINEK